MVKRLNVPCVVITGCRFVTLGTQVERLVLTSSVGVHVYDASNLGEVCEHLEESPEADFFFKGVVGIFGQPFLVVGNSHGKVLMLHHKRSRIGVEEQLGSHRNAITCLDASPIYLVSADEFGSIKVHEIATRQVVMSYASAGACCTTVLIRGEVVSAGFVNGVIRVYHLRADTIRVEINAHARAISSMDIHPFENLVVSGGEDCYLNVWEIEENKQASPLSSCRVNLVQSVHLEDSVITGCAFAKGGSHAIAVASYDSKTISILSRD